MTLIIIAHTHSQYLAFLRAKFPAAAHGLRERANFILADPLLAEPLLTIERGAMVYCLTQPHPRVQKVIRERFNEIFFIEAPHV